MVRAKYILLSLLLLLLPLAVPAQNTRKQESRKAVLQREIEQINRQLKENAKNSSRALSSLQLVRQKISRRKELIAESEREIKTYDDSIQVYQAEINRQQARLDTLSRYYSRLVRSAYKNRDNRLWYMYILASQNLGQGFRRFSYLRGLSREMSRQATEVRDLSAALSQKRDTLAGMNPDIPVNYFPKDNPEKPPRVNWRSTAYLIFGNWLNYYVYQNTPYDLNEIGRE